MAKNNGSERNPIDFIGKFQLENFLVDYVLASLHIEYSEKID